MPKVTYIYISSNAFIKFAWGKKNEMNQSTFFRDWFFHFMDDFS